MDSNHLCVKQNKGMTPREIKNELSYQGVLMTEIAKAAGVTRSAVSQTINRYSYTHFKGYRIRTLIASALGKKVDDIWPDEAAF